MNTRKPGYRGIAAYYRDLIATGQLRPGDRLPTIRSAMHEWEVSNQTVVRAYTLLSREGLTSATSGAGTVVADTSSPGLVDRVQRYAATGSALSSVETSRILHVGEVAAPEEIAFRLRVSPGDQVWSRQRVVESLGQVLHLSTSYYSQRVIDAVPELTQPVSTGGSRELASDRLGASQAHVLEEIWAESANVEDSVYLGVPRGSPIIVVTRTVWLSDNTVVEVAVKRTARSLKFSSALTE